jgi:hypothetical protein
MATLVTLGLSKILGKTGEPQTCDFTETGYTPYGLTYEDTCNMSQEDPETNEFYAEEEDDFKDEPITEETEEIHTEPESEEAVSEEDAGSEEEI